MIRIHHHDQMPPQSSIHGHGPLPLSDANMIQDRYYYHDQPAGYRIHNYDPISDLLSTMIIHDAAAAAAPGSAYDPKKKSSLSQY